MSASCISTQQYNIYFTGLDSVSCGEFCGQPTLNFNNHGTPDSQAVMRKSEEKPLCQGHLEEGATIIYVPTRKQTLGIAKFLSRFGVKAAAYNAKVTVSSHICHTLFNMFIFLYTNVFHFSIT